MDNFAPSTFAQGSSQYPQAQDPSQSDFQLPDETPGDANPAGDGSYVPRPKRIACVVCRRRKLRCDGKRPSCGTCSRLGHECSYDEQRKKSGPKRGYVKQLEARLGMNIIRNLFWISLTTRSLIIISFKSPSRDPVERPGYRSAATPFPSTSPGKCLPHNLSK